MIVLDQLNCLASLADVFDLSVLEKNQNWCVADSVNSFKINSRDQGP